MVNQMNKKELKRKPTKIFRKPLIPIDYKYPFHNRKLGKDSSIKKGAKISKKQFLILFKHYFNYFLFIEIVIIIAFQQQFLYNISC